VSLPEPLVPLVTAWRSAVRTPRRRALVAAAMLLVAITRLSARGGTPRARLVASGILATAVIGVVVVARRDARGWRDPREAIDRLAGNVDPVRAARAQRALGLLDEGRALHEGTSPALAALHVRRALAALPGDAIEQGANRIAHRFANATLVLALAVLAVAVFAPWPVFEGLDVLLARDHKAPFAMAWLDEPLLHSRPPDYLHQTEFEEPAGGQLVFARGTLLTMRGAPIHPARKLVLTDGTNEVPFVDDGQGNVIARWPVEATVDLRVVARFGDVGIRESDATHIESIADEEPVVTLEGAPKRIELARAEDSGEIAIRYQATDDHGLREVHLVLRSGTREERRVLARLDGETRTDEGGYVLRATDSFIKKSHVPVEVRVEAKDNDPITGPKWGASAAFTIVPPDVGEPQAIRLEALRALRDRFVDSLAWRMERPVPAKLADRRGMLAEEGKTVDDDAELLDATLSGEYAGIRIPGRLQALLRGQMRKVREAMTQEARVASPQTHAALVKTSEKIALVADAIVAGLGQRDTRSSAKQLADVADDVVLGETEEARDAERERGRMRADAGVGVLAGGGKSMRRLGELGRDIGEIVASDLSRIARGRAGEDWPHAELAARDLAARLRQPDPSFGSKGGPSKGGGESGGGRGSEGEGGGDDEKGDADDVEQAFNEAAQDLEQLAQDHANAMSKTENALANGASEDDVKAMNDEAKKHAEKVREAVRDLPKVGAGSETTSGKSAAAREQAEQMASALEQGSPADAVSSGKNALQSLDEAERAARSDPWARWNDQGSEAEKAIDGAKKKLEGEIAWAEQKVSDLRKKAAERAKDKLSSQGQEENAMAERTRQLGEKGHEQMPGSALDALEEAEKSMQHAADELRSGDADKAIARQREAQRQLEMAKQAMGSDDDPSDSSGNPQSDKDGDGSDASNGRTDIPNADDHKGPEDFRRRVTDGLSKPSSGRLKDAVRRYAEGLLR
jgi:hypothetical protein